MRAARAGPPRASSAPRSSSARLRPAATCATWIAAARSESARDCKPFAHSDGEAAQEFARVKASPPGALQFQDLKCAFAAGDPNPLRARGNDGTGFVATVDNPRAPDLASLAAQFDLRTGRGAERSHSTFKLECRL